MEDAIEVAPSEESGNVPAELPVETPSEQPEIETPAGEPTEETPTTPTEELYKLPDGREVDAATLSKEWKENFLPEFTRKSQLLKEREEPNQNNKPPEKPFDDPTWQPSSWKEAMELAKQEALSEIEAKEKARVEQRQALENSVVTQIAELKKTDPTLNENALFLHANEYREKYGVSFPDLKSAYTHMKDIGSLTKTVQQATAKNIAKRSDPVSATPGASGATQNPSAFGSAIEYLRSLK